MELKELLRIAAENEKRRKDLGLDDATLKRIRDELAATRNSRHFLAYERYPEQLREQILALTSHLNQSAYGQFSSIFESIRDANLSALNLTGNADARSFVLGSLQNIAGVGAAAWTEHLKLSGAGTSIEDALKNHLSHITETSYLAQMRLAGLNIGQLGTGFHLEEIAKNAITQNLTDLSVSYKNLFQSFELPETSFLALPPSISALPTFEYFNEADLLRATTDEYADDEYADDEIEEDLILVREEIKIVIVEPLIERLTAVNPHWTKMLEGARQALRSDNPDKVRHAIASLRELTREVMQYLSPDENIKHWSSSEGDFSNGRPTRIARLRYIARSINHGPLVDFVEKDLKSVLAAIDVFQAGTHSADSRLTEIQVRALLARAEGILHFLMSIGGADGH